MYLADFHLHSLNSFDSRSEMAELCDRAISDGLTEVCFAEHFSLNPQAPTHGHMDWTRYRNDIAENRARLAGQLTIRKGIEICEPHLDRAGYQEILAAGSVDFVLGSVHNVNDQKLRNLLKNHDRRVAYGVFFLETLAMVQLADIDGVAHLDLIKRYSGQPFSEEDFQDYQSVLEEILQTMIDRRLALEINTSSMHSLHETMPGAQILRLYRQLGGTLLTFGSDAHTPGRVGDSLAAAMVLARACGFESYSTYAGRQEVRHAIPG
jgi:histidinol-phosphatase (PHP family)